MGLKEIDSSNSSPETKRPRSSSKKTRANAATSSTNSVVHQVLENIDSDTFRRDFLPYLSAKDTAVLSRTNKSLKSFLNPSYDQKTAFDDLNLVWKQWFMNHINSKVSDFAGDIIDWKELYRFVHHTLPQTFYTSEFSELTGNLYKAIRKDSPLDKYLILLLKDNDDNYYEDLKDLSNQGFKPAQSLYADDIYWQRHLQSITEAKRFEVLKNLADSGNELAQNRVAGIILQGHLGQNLIPAPDRFSALQDLATKNNRSAQ